MVQNAINQLQGEIKLDTLFTFFKIIFHIIYYLIFKLI